MLVGLKFVVKITLLLLAEVVHPQPYKIAGEFQYYVLYSTLAFYSSVS